MRIATWNVNSIRARLDGLVSWLDRCQPDVVLLQETKVVDDDFPTSELLRRGYAVAIAGQKTYNGVAILSRLPLSEVTIGMPCDPPEADRRFIAARTGPIVVVSAYVPNGKDVEHPAFSEKLAWLGRFRETLESLLVRCERHLVVGGDFNVALEPRDVWSPETYEGKIHFHPDERRCLRALLALGLLDAFRLFCQEPGAYSWWDYRGTSARQNRGLRIDYLLVSDVLAPSCKNSFIEREMRGGERPSDHVPVVVDLEIAT